MLQKEADAREAALEEQRQREAEAAGGGSFPILSATAASRYNVNIHTPPRQAPSEPRKVLSLNSKTKRVMVSSFSPAARSLPVGSVSHSDVEEEDEFSSEAVPPRVPLPPDEPSFVSRRGTERRWQNLHTEGYMYVEAPQSAGEAGRSKSGKTKTPRAKEKS